MHDLRPAAEEMTRLVSEVRDDQLGDPTPCPAYTLGDLLDHVRDLAEAFTLAGRKEQPPAGSQPPQPGNAALLTGDWRGQTATWLRRLAEAWADPAAWEGTSWIAGAEMPASVIGLVATNELVAHGWDVARATGAQLTVDEAALAAAAEFVAMMSGPGSEEMRGDAFGPPVPVGPEAGPLDRVVAGNGRDPAWSAGAARLGS